MRVIDKMLVFVNACAGLVVCSATACAAGMENSASQNVEISPLAFERGGWGLDQQSMAELGTPYLIAHGLGEPVADAKAAFELEEGGRRRVWARTRNWHDGAPGRFRVAIDGVELPHEFGAGSPEWSWEDGGEVELSVGRHVVSLRDSTGFDGVKLDFIDAFRLPDPDPAVAENYAGRDYRSLPAAIDRIMKDVLARLRKINPDVLVEFRQRYMGPAILQYGNMIRASDCPADPCANRKRVCDLRLTSGAAAVYSDMLVWSRDETPEGAALPILNVLFSTIQYSMILEKINPAHRDVIRHWLAFSQKHREALLKGAFRPHHPENGYTWIEGESADERIVAAYSGDVVLDCGAADKKAILVNATGSDGLYAKLPARPRSIRLFDVLGRERPAAPPSVGLAVLPVPAGGYAELAW